MLQGEPLGLAGARRGLEMTRSVSRARGVDLGGVSGSRGPSTEFCQALARGGAISDTVGELPRCGGRRYTAPETSTGLCEPAVSRIATPPGRSESPPIPMHSVGLARLFSFGLATLACQTASAQEDLEGRIVELEERLAALEMDATEDFALVATYGDVSATFQLFGNVLFEATDSPAPDDSNASFTFESLDAFVSVQVGDHFQALSETVISPSHGSGALSQERLWGAWTFDDRLYAKLGLEHSPITLWNRRYHHGAWLEPTIERPLVASFEGSTDGFLPLHNQGLELGGSAPLGGGMLTYTGILSNGRGITPAEKQPGEDLNDSKAVVAALSWSPFDEAYSFGVAGHLDRVPANPGSLDAVLLDEVEELIGSVFVEASLGPVELLTEFAVMTNKTKADGAEYDHTAGYLQLLYPHGDWTPYLRFDFKDMDEGDPYLAQLDRDLDQWRQTVGVRWDIASRAALKVEARFGERHERIAGSGITREDFVVGAVQLSFGI